MAFKHNYINTGGSKPLASEMDTLELVPNFADGTLWTKRTGGAVIGVGERYYGVWTNPTITSPYHNNEIVISNSERLKYRLIDLNTIIVSGAFTLTGFPFNQWLTITSLPENIVVNKRATCYGIAKLFDSHTASVMSAIDTNGNIKLYVSRVLIDSNENQRFFIQVTGRLF